MDADLLYSKLALPLLRLTVSLGIGLLVASLLESLRWTRHIARLASPLARLGHLRELSAASFALAFFSSDASNSLLAEAHARGELSRRELIFANLFNSSPTFLVHLPTLFTLVFAFLGPLAFVYVGLSFAASVLRTLVTVAAGRLLLPPLPADRSLLSPEESGKGGDPWSAGKTMRGILRRFKKRLVKLLRFTIPVYCLFFLLQQGGVFSMAESWLAAHSGCFSFLNPKALGIVGTYLVAESGAALSAAAALGDAGALASREVILALLVGNILSTPMRAVRHQFPSYVAFFTPSLALRLMLMNQLCRAASLILVALVYYRWTYA